MAIAKPSRPAWHPATGSPRRTTAERAGLTASSVVDAAMAVIDDEGVEAFTMRRLADRLGVYPAALYWHAKNKPVLIAEACERVIAETRLPEVEGNTWDEWLREMARAWRRNIRRHPNFGPILSSQLQVNPASLPFAESVLAALGRGGFRREKLRDSYNLIMGAVFGFIDREVAVTPPDKDESWADGFRERLHGIDPVAYPNVAGNMEFLEGESFMFRWEPGDVRPLDESFEFMLDTVLSGLRAMPRE